MPVNIFGVALSFVSTALYAGSNILDSFFSNKIVTYVTPLIFLSSLFGLIITPIVWFFSPPQILPLPLFAILLAIVGIQIAYQYPYYWSLRLTDTSVVTSLFSLGKIITPLIAFFLLGERLSESQYIGFILIICSATALTLDIKKLRFNTAFYLMLFTSLILSISAILEKYLYNHGVGWGSVIIYIALLQFFISGLCMLIPKHKKELATLFGNVRRIGVPYLLEEMGTWGGDVTSAWGLFLIPVSVLRALGSTQPLFVLAYTLLFERKLPDYFKEDGELPLKKITFYVLIVLGTILVL